MWLVAILLDSTDLYPSRKVIILNVIFLFRRFFCQWAGPLLLLPYTEGYKQALRRVCKVEMALKAK